MQQKRGAQAIITMDKKKNLRIFLGLKEALGFNLFDCDVINQRYTLQSYEATLRIDLNVYTV